MENKQNLLIVDDSPTILSILKEMLKGNGFAIRTAAGGEEALIQAAADPPDIILLDIEMPGIDGFETCRRFKAEEKLAGIPILFLSSFEDIAKKVKAFRAGGVDYISKPVQREELIARVEIHLELKRLQEQLYRRIADKDRLIHILCHDVSNPLTCITGWAEMMANDPALGGNEKMSYRLRRILQSAQQVAGIIDHVREMEKLALQKKELRLRPVSIREVIDSTLVIFENQFKNKDITFICTPPHEELDAHVIAEKISFTTNVFHNLFSNMIKFSYPHSVISLTVEDKDENIQLVLKDQGVGIPKNLLEKIFDPAASTSRPGTVGEQGSGFGMPLVKQYMDYYGGRILISSRPEEEYPDLHGTEIQLILKKGKKAAAAALTAYESILAGVS